MVNARRTHNLDGPSALRILEGAMDLGLQGGGQILKKEMQRLAPIDTGQMTRSVYVSETEQDRNGYSVSVGPTPGYSKYTELEPWIIGKRPGPKSQIKGASIPWMRPAADNKHDEIIDHITKGVRITIRELAARMR